jgi:hypothetical protein
MFTAAYLAAGKQLGRNRVSKINFYGDRSMIKNIKSMAPGIMVESMIAIVAPTMIAAAPYALYSYYNNNEGLLFR